ncbi:WG repeat-containing protein, partial [Sphaerospermopsis aphanizomenoides BCCUSP55]|uniref:WG repeat-containing protein n=1 Tax=Sphaerospermopsis aphanizomenoides TaxID=459663 RepID=UPI001906DE97
MEIRGVWLTTTNSKVLDSRQNIAEAMKFLADIGFNVVFPVVWNNGSTNYRSQVMKEKFGIEIKDRKEFKDRDPLQELIAEAKKFDIAVIPWLEYGFMSSYQGNGGKIIQTKKEWAARDLAGNPLVKNDFYWLNSLDSEVQDFLLSLFLEVVTKYDVAGIQGDDHFIALPIEGGYDQKTIERYKQTFNRQPPENFKDPQWLRWRADILSNFLIRFYQEIINVNPDLIISMSPSIYPWGYENYLQDSQTWVDLGLVDLIHPQVYREKIENYKIELDRIRKEQFTQQQLPQFIPGILINKTGTYRIEGQDLLNVIQYNRSVGIQGEVLFFYEGLRENNDALANVLKSSVYSLPPGKFDAKEIKKNTFTQRRINNNYTYINAAQEISLKVRFDWVEPFSEGMAAVKIGYKWGYIDKTGKLVGRIEYDTAEPYSEGLALVKINNDKNRYIGYIDKTGKRITNLINNLKIDDALSFSEGMAAVKIGNKWGYITPTFDQTGNIIITVIPLQFQFDAAQSFSEGLAAVKIGNKWTYIDKTGQTVIKLEFDDAGSFSAGLAAVKVGKQWGYIDKFSNFVIKPQFDEVDIFVEGLAPAKIGGKWGYINQFGEFIIAPEFEVAKPFSQGLALVNIGGRLEENKEQGKADLTGGKWGYIDKFSNFVIKPQFDEVDIFVEGLAPAKIGGKWGYINQFG